MDLFDVGNDGTAFDPNFWTIAKPPAYKGTRQLINEVFNSWDGFDNHFVQEFRTTNFNSRLWEIYLYATFKSLGYNVRACPEGRPDFKLFKDGVTVFVEAVTSNPVGNTPKLIPSVFENESLEATMIKLRSTLTTKVAKEYWELPWVHGYPLVLAICPFHSSEALNIVDFDMINYLYGVKLVELLDEDGINRFDEYKYDKIRVGEKLFSPFFELPRASNISGILFSNTGTIGKFSRLAFQRGYDNDRVHSFYYSGSYADPRVDGLGIGQFSIELQNKEPREFTDEWQFGATVFLNHNAKISFPEGFFGGMTQRKYTHEDGLLRIMAPFHPYNAKNLKVIPQ
jgi:hypothetical protein